MKLEELEDALKERGFKIIYARGNFNSGYCRVKDSNVILVNKFFDKKGRLLCLKEILDEVMQEIQNKA
ncbi:MAG: hypothetical protein EA409_01735 [Saprospirales bacterium]|nr:MAG: hypothetical protein EA409_01735 [Saprospirales bacterium]